MSVFGTVLKGGSAGKVVVAGRASASLLFQAITNEDAEARMPPNSPPLSVEKIKMIRVWIQDGLRESSGSKSLASTRDLNFKPSGHVAARPEGPPPMPDKLPEIELPKTKRPLPVLALAASPWGTAIGGVGTRPHPAG